MSTSLLCHYQAQLPLGKALEKMQGAYGCSVSLASGGTPWLLALQINGEPVLWGLRELVSHSHSILHRLCERKPPCLTFLM